MKLSNLTDKPRPALRYQTLCVLIIEDVLPHRALLKRMLKKLGVMQIYEAGNGEEGLAMTRDLLPDLVLCDLMMEPMNGFAFLRALRVDHNRRTAKTPVVMTSAMSESGTVMKACVLEANTYIAKPFRLPQLQSAIEYVYPHTAGTAFTVKRFSGTAETDNKWFYNAPPLRQQ